MQTLRRRLRDYAQSHIHAMRELVATLGLRLFIFIIAVLHVIKGFVAGGGGNGLVGRPIEFLFQSYASHGMPVAGAQNIQLWRSVALTPWALKSLMGILCDTVHLGGYGKLPYMFGALVAAVLACLTLAGAWPLAPVPTTALLFVIFLACALTDLLTEAMYSRVIMRRPDKGVEITTFVQTGIFCGSIVSTVVVGTLIDLVAPHWIYLVPVPFFLGALCVVYSNMLGDSMHTNQSHRDTPTQLVLAEDSVDTLETVATGPDHLTNMMGSCGWFTYDSGGGGASSTDDDVGTASADGTVVVDAGTETDSSISSDTDVSFETDDQPILTPLIGVNLTKIRVERNAFILASLVAFVSCSTSLMAICGIRIEYLFAFSLVSACGMMIGFALLVDGVTARIQIYVILQNMCSISTSGAEFFFFTDDAGAYPEGPHFSKPFFVIVVGLVAAGCSILGALSYGSLMKSWNYQRVFLVNTLFPVFAGLLNIIIYKRWNVACGIPDRVFVLGAETVQVVVGAWNNMPFTTMMSQLCPYGTEATMFALMAGSSNLGASLAVYQGTYALKLLGINPNGATGESAQFENMWLVPLIASCLALVPIPFIPLLIPDRLQTDSLLPGRETRQTQQHQGIPESFDVALSSLETATDEEVLNATFINEGGGEEEEEEDYDEYGIVDSIRRKRVYTVHNSSSSSSSSNSSSGSDIALHDTVV